MEVDGHDVLSLQSVLLEQKASSSGRPKALIARTLKGRGVPGLENAPLSHIINPKPELIDSLLEKKP
jgi:transketolase